MKFHFTQMVLFLGDAPSENKHIGLEDTIGPSTNEPMASQLSGGKISRSKPL